MDDLTTLKTRASASIASFTGSSVLDHGPTKNVNTAYTTTIQSISTLENEFTSVRGGSIAEKIAFLDSVTNKLSAINTSVSNLETSISTWIAPAAAAAAPAAAAPAAAAPAAAPTTPSSNIEGISDFGKLGTYLNTHVQYSFMLAGVDTTIIDSEIQRLNTDKSYRNMVLQSSSILSYYQTHFSGLGVEIFEWKSNNFRVGLSEIAQDLRRIDSAFPNARTFSDIGGYISGLSDTTLKGNLRSALENFRIRK